MLKETLILIWPDFHFLLARIIIFVIGCIFQKCLLFSLLQNICLQNYFQDLINTGKFCSKTTNVLGFWILSYNQRKSEEQYFPQRGKIISFKFLSFSLFPTSPSCFSCISPVFNYLKKIFTKHLYMLYLGIQFNRQTYFYLQFMRSAMLVKKFP